jgi:hypothetical protein
MAVQLKARAHLRFRNWGSQATRFMAKGQREPKKCGPGIKFLIRGLGVKPKSLRHFVMSDLKNVLKSQCALHSMTQPELKKLIKTPKFCCIIAKASPSF